MRCLTIGTVARGRHAGYLPFWWLRPDGRYERVRDGKVFDNIDDVCQFLGSVTPVVVQRHVRGVVMAEPGSIIMCLSTEAFARISYSGFACAVRTWKYGTLFLCALYLLPVVYGTSDSSGDGFWQFRNAWLDDGYMFCVSTWLQGDLQIFSTLPWTRILKCLVFVLTQKGDECSVDASVSVLVALLVPGKLEIQSRVPRGWR